MRTVKGPPMILAADSAVSAVSSGRVGRVLRSAFMADHLDFYIDGAWVPPITPATRDVINPATEQPIGKISMGTAEDVDRAVKAARKAFDTYSRTTREERVALLENIIRVFKAKQDELATTISTEVGAPMWLSQAQQAVALLGHLSPAPPG